MLPSNSIVVIVYDSGLLRSLAFALEVEGFHAQIFDDWTKAEPATTQALCTIVDAEVCRKDQKARRALLDRRMRTILLSDGMPPQIEHAGSRVLMKPFQGMDLIAAVRSFLAHAHRQIH